MKYRLKKIIISLLVLSLGGYAGIRAIIANRVNSAVRTVESVVEDYDIDLPGGTRLQGTGDIIRETVINTSSDGDSIESDLVTFEYVNDNHPYLRNTPSLMIWGAVGWPTQISVRN